jgi:hypothetical protein
MIEFNFRQNKIKHIFIKTTQLVTISAFIKDFTDQKQYFQHFIKQKYDGQTTKECNNYKWLKSTSAYDKHTKEPQQMFSTIYSRWRYINFDSIMILLTLFFV